jgi:hypothetical protein
MLPLLLKPPHRCWHCLQDERALRQLTGAMQAELAAAASGSRPDTPNGGMTSGEQPSA